MPSPFLVVALSGLSSTGKSTIASHLPSIFSPPFYILTILHVDDFYKAQTDLPYRQGLLDWDCAQSLDWPSLEDAVRQWRDGFEIEEGKVNPQPQFQDAAVTGDHGKTQQDNGITQALVEQFRSEAPVLRPERGIQRILVLDGFLLFTPSVPATFRSTLDLKFLLRAPYAEAKMRRESRSGYATMEGWWEDPPEYFDKVVWPNYVEENKGFFIEGRVEGEINDGVCKKEGVKVWMGKADGLAEPLGWVFGEMRRMIEAGEL
ncbi:MAG: hypothetical protein Q9209_005385 [Squamulea sp. 1 TL-2023]